MSISLIKESLEASREGDVGTALEAIGESLGLPPGEYFDTMVGAFNDFFSTLVKQTPQERQVTVAEHRLKGVESRMNRATRKQETFQKKTEYTRQLEAFVKDYDVEEEEVEHCYNVLQAKAREQYEKEGGEKPQVTVNSITELVLNRRIMRGVIDAVDSLELDITNDDQMEVFRIIKKCGSRWFKFFRAGLHRRCKYCFRRRVP